jgi:hypothetical protein
MVVSAFGHRTLSTGRAAASTARSSAADNDRRTLDHDDFGSNRFKIMNVIISYI